MRGINVQCGNRNLMHIAYGYTQKTFILVILKTNRESGISPCIIAIPTYLSATVSKTLQKLKFAFRQRKHPEET